MKEIKEFGKWMLENYEVNIFDYIKKYESEQKVFKFVFSEQSTDDFKNRFLDFSKSKKQKTKANATLQKILNKLSLYDEPFAIELMEISQMSESLGVVYLDTPKKYQQYLNSKNGNTNSKTNSINGLQRVQGKRLVVFGEADFDDEGNRI